MAASAQTVLALPKPSVWFQDFLKKELAPYPGRAGTVARMVIAATLVMIICVTFRIPYAFQGAIYALLVSRENPRATLESAGIMALITSVSAAYILLSAWFVISVPTLHFFWIIVTFFVAFYALGTVTNYSAVTMFTNMVSVAVPLWDRHVSAESNVEDTLRVVLVASIGVVVTALVELGFARVKPGDNVVAPIVRRLSAVHSLLACYIESRPVDQTTDAEITRLAFRGTSSLRSLLRRSDYSPPYRSQMSGVVALVGELVDLAATLTEFPFAPSSADQKQLRDLAAGVANIRTGLLNRKIPASLQFHPGGELSHAVPLLREMENIVTLIPQAFAGSSSIDEYLPPPDGMPGPKLLLPDAFTNPEHFRFALKGCLAASLCYIIYNSIAWPGISTAVTTCLLTGLSAIGASRQKGILRFAGAVVGGFIIGMGSQIFILPYLDSIAGFTVLFMLVTAFSAWFMTSSPRLSYFGLQVALAFYLINLQGFAMERSLSIARDRVVGILLGLFMMSLVFDQLLGARRAAVDMKRTFISGLRLLAEFANEPRSNDRRVAVARSYSLHETINANFDRVRSSADAVIFEFSSSRRQDLALRTRIRQWQPQLRSLFLTRSVLLKYRLQLPGFELPQAVRAAQQEFDDNLAKMLDGMADRLEGKSQGKATPERDNFEDSFNHLEQTVQTFSSQAPQELPTKELQTFLTLSRSIETLTLSLDDQMDQQT